MKIIKFKRLLVLTSLIFLGYSNAKAQSEKLQAVFIYNFIKLIEWPASYSSGDFQIGVFGTSPILTELENIAQSKTIGHQKIVIKKFRSVNEIEKCHILFITPSKSDDIQQAIARIKDFSTLVVTDRPGLTQFGSAINFQSVNNKQKFELKKLNATKYGLKISSDLEKLAIIIN